MTKTAAEILKEWEANRLDAEAGFQSKDLLRLRNALFALYQAVDVKVGQISGLKVGKFVLKLVGATTHKDNFVTCWRIVAHQPPEKELSEACQSYLEVAASHQLERSLTILMVTLSAVPALLFVSAASNPDPDDSEWDVDFRSVTDAKLDGWFDELLAGKVMALCS
jgi:hypothetical protein